MSHTVPIQILAPTELVPTGPYAAVLGLPAGFRSLGPAITPYDGSLTAYAVVDGDTPPATTFGVALIDIGGEIPAGFALLNVVQIVGGDVRAFCTTLA